MKLIIWIAPMLLAIACKTQSIDGDPAAVREENPAPVATQTAASAPVVTDTMSTPPNAPVTGTMSTAPITTTTTASTTPVPSAPVSDNVRRITLDETIRALNAGTAVLVDVRTEEQYKLSHAKGAIHIPETQIVERLAELPFNKTIITYCA